MAALAWASTPSGKTSTFSSIPSLLAQYDAFLRAYLRTFDEGALHDAHEFGREMLSRGYGVLDVVGLHHRLAAPLLDPDAGARLPRDLDAAGRLLLEVLTPFEMTHRGFRSANASLQESEERYRELFENANDIVFTTDLNGRVTSINHAGERLSGYSRDEARLLDLKVMLPHAAGSGAEMALADLQRREVEMVARDGRRMLLEISTRPIFEGGQAVGMQGIARDITDRRNAESALRHLNNHLEDKAKRIAHGLHDEAGQLLATVYLRVAEISGSCRPSDAAAWRNCGRCSTRSTISCGGWRTNSVRRSSMTSVSCPPVSSSPKACHAARESRSS